MAEKKIFAVIAADRTDELGASISSAFPENRSIGVGQWLVVGASTLTTQEVSNQIGITVENPISSGIVLSVNSYFGRAPLDVWEWLTAKLGETHATAGR